MTGRKPTPVTSAREGPTLEPLVLPNRHVNSVTSHTVPILDDVALYEVRPLKRRCLNLLQMTTVRDDVPPNLVLALREDTDVPNLPQDAVRLRDIARDHVKAQFSVELQPEELAL